MPDGDISSRLTDAEQLNLALRSAEERVEILSSVLRGLPDAGQINE